MLCDGLLFVINTAQFFCINDLISYPINSLERQPVILQLAEGDMGGVLNTATPQKKINEHRITARKVNETPSPQVRNTFLAP